MREMAVAVIDVGSNSVRLLVAVARGDGVVPLHEERVYPRLGAEVERHGEIRPAKLAEVGAVVRQFVEAARQAGATRTEALVTAPGRQAANADDLLDAIAHAARVPVRVLTAEEEGALAYRGALLRAGALRDSVAVCDVGGGSTELAVGRGARGPDWIRSVDVGALRLTTAHLQSDPPTADDVSAARTAARGALTPLDPPEAEVAFAVGGSARALARVAGRNLSAARLARALDAVTAQRAAKVARLHHLDEQRARTLAAGAVILAEVSAVLDRPLRLGSGGLREGAVAGMLAERLAA